MPTFEACLIGPTRLWACAELDLPIGFVRLDETIAGQAVGALPPYPLIGIGAHDHPLAAAMDAMVEPPVSAARLFEQVLENPRAAAAAVLLLRAIEGKQSIAALAMESTCMAMLQGSLEHRAWLARRRSVAPSAPGKVRIERTGRCLVIRMERPWAFNSVDRAMRDGLADAFEIAALDPDVEEVRLTAVGKAFSLGADLAEFGTTLDPATAHLIRIQTLPARYLIAMGGKLTVHVQGACVGAGLEIAAFARRITAAPDAWFQLPELAMGIIPGAGGCVSLPQRIGRHRTALMLLSGRRIGARTALDWGLIDAIDEGGAHAD